MQNFRHLVFNLLCWPQRSYKSHGHYGHYPPKGANSCKPSTFLHLYLFCVYQKICFPHQQMNLTYQNSFPMLLLNEQSLHSNINLINFIWYFLPFVQQSLIMNYIRLLQLFWPIAKLYYHRTMSF